jgi:hypothetical protein
MELLAPKPKQAKNSIFWGILMSITATLFGCILVYVLKYMPSNQDFNTFLNDLQESNLKKSAVISLSLLANLPLMYFNQKRKLWQNFKGISAVIIILGLLMINYKFNIL